ncbi:hypothetical protein RUM44_004419 [Polyplax serrata]|uniref:EF-hand domain-containing protein n=1 Tax=Polyplax serrata TaxID=468196 RepID=A0ABR1B2T0_POLSC
MNNVSPASSVWDDEEENITQTVIEEEVKEVDPRSLLEKEQVDFFREVFDAIDVDKKGKIPAKTMGYVLRTMGLNPTKADIKKHIMEIDPQKKGYIDFYAFLLPLAQRIEDQPETYEDILAAFKVLDEEDNGYLTTDQLYEFLTTLGEELEDFEIELLLKMSETKGTGKIYYQEFVEKMMGIVKPKAKGKNGKK